MQLHVASGLGQQRGGFAEGIGDVCAGLQAVRTGRLREVMPEEALEKEPDGVLKR